MKLSNDELVLNIKFCNGLRYWMKIYNCSRYQMANAIGVSKHTVDRLLVGDTQWNLVKAYKACKHLGISIESII